MTPRLRETLKGISEGKTTNALLAAALQMHVNSAARLAKMLAADGYVTSVQTLSIVGDARFRDAGRVKIRHYAITPKGLDALG